MKKLITLFLCLGVNQAFANTINASKHDCSVIKKYVQSHGKVKILHKRVFKKYVTTVYSWKYLKDNNICKFPNDETATMIMRTKNKTFCSVGTVCSRRTNFPDTPTNPRRDFPRN